MPQGNRSHSRKNRNRRRAQQLTAVAESSQNGERRKHEKEAFAAAYLKSNDDGSKKTNDSVSIDPIQGDDRDESRHRGYKFRPDDKRSIEKIEVMSRPRTVEITTFSSLPLEATIGHIAGVGILETGIRDRMVTQEPTVVMVSEPVESPFLEHSRIKHRSFEADDDKGDPWAKGDRLEIREVSDSDAEADPTTIEVDSESNLSGESEPNDEIRQQIVPRKRLSETESLTLKWNTVVPRMMERKFPRKRNILESVQLPSFFEEKGSCGTFTEKVATEEDEPVEKMAVLLRRRMKKRAISELHYPNSFLNIIQEEGDRMSEDEAQHIRDFINEEISKYRRKNKHSSERTIEGEAEEDDTCGDIATLCENDVSANIDTVKNDICIELHPSDAANSSGEFAAAVGSAEDIEAEVIEDAESAIKAMDSVSFNEPIEIVSNGMQSNLNRIENRTAKSILQRSEDEEKLASEKPDNLENNVRIDDTPPLYDTNDTNKAQDSKLLHKIETIEKSENRKDHKVHSSFNLYNEATSSKTKQFLPPPLPPKRSSSFGHGLQRLPTSIEIEASSSNVCRLLPKSNGTTNCKTEKLESSQRPELRKCESPSASKIDRAVYEVDSSNPREFAPSSNSTVELDDCEGERMGTASKTGYVEPASADPSIALSGICNDNPHGVALATGTEITRCQEGRPAAPAVPSASSNRQGNETEANRNDLVKRGFKAGFNAHSPDESSTSDRSYTRPNCPTKDGLEMHRCPSDNNDAEKLGREEEEFNFHHERTVKSETLETRIIEREETSSIDQQINYRDSNNSLRDLKREERYENSFNSLGFQPAVDIPVNVNFFPAEMTDFQGRDSSSSTASLSTVRHRPLETSLTDISAIVQETKDDSLNDEPDESLKWKLTLLKNGESTDTTSGECSGSPQPIPYSPVEDLYYVPLNIDFAVEEREKTLRNTLYRTIQQHSPSSLRELCVKKILSMPFGSQIISEITTAKFNIFEGLRSLQRFVSNVPSARRDNVRLNPHGVNEPRPNDMAGLTKTSSAHESLRPNDFENAVSDYVMMPEGVNIETRLSNAEGESKHGNWKCLSTSKDPRLLVCLSPSQQATSVRTSADALLDLHQKFLKRYSYREEQPHRAPLLRYRVQVCPTTKEDDDDANGIVPMKSTDRSGRSTSCNAVMISSNRLLEIIKEHSPGDPDFQNGTLADRQSEMVNDSSNSSYAFERKEHLDAAAHPYDCPNKANRRECAAVNELFLAAARSEDDKPGHAIPGYQSRIAPRPIVEVKYRRSSDNTMIRDSEKLDALAESFVESSSVSNNAAIDRSSCDVAAKRAAPWRTTDFGKHVNPALIDDKLEVPPLPKRAVTVDRSCIDVTSIFDQSPLVLPKERETTDELIKHMATAEIMDQLKRLQTETSQRLDGNRRSSLPQGCFVQQLKYIEALEEQLKNVILAEEEERKAFEELQMYVRRTKQYDDAKTLSPAGIHEDTWWETNATPECECETRIDDRNRITDSKLAENKQDVRQGSVNHLGRAYRIDPKIRMESWQGKSSNSENDCRQGTGIIDRTHGKRRFLNGISLEKGVYEEELPENIEDRECRAASKKGNVGALENGGTSKFHEKALGACCVVKRTNEITKMLEGGMSIEKTTRGNAYYNDAKSKKNTMLPTTGEAFRQRMYDEYMRKMLERQGRKNHKIVKISSHESTLRKMNGKSDDMSAIAKEFIEKARTRLSKSDHDESETDHEEKEYRDDSDGMISAKCLIDGEELEDIRKLPKHLREFLKISAIINDEGGELRRMDDCCVIPRVVR